MCEVLYKIKIWSQFSSFHQSTNTLLHKMFWLYIVFFIITFKYEGGLKCRKESIQHQLTEKFLLKVIKDNSRAYLKRGSKVNII
jgi:hypothetical protein